MPGFELLQGIQRGIHVFLIIFITVINDLQNQIRFHCFFQGGVKGIEELVRKRTDEAYRIGKQEFFTLLLYNSSNGGIEGGKKHIFFFYALCLIFLTDSKKCIHKARLSGIGIADQCNSRNSRSISFLSFYFSYFLLLL